ncbi:MAG: Fic family protein [Coriobacteriaceae bacterium]|nr:Fic family protein [Coriobacteriaceae bacterium]
MPKRPEPAPAGDLSAEPLGRMVAALHSGGLSELFRRANREYLYWDRFKHLPMPEGVEPADAWRFVKVLRGIDRKPTAVRDVHGHTFTYMLTEEMQRCLHLIDRDAGGRITTTDAGIPGYAQQRYLISSLMEEAIASSQIEGASTTRKAAKDMLRTGRRPKNRAERMILNNYRTISELREMPDEPFSPGLIVQIQEWLTEDTLEDPADVGRLRETDDILVHDNATGTVLHVPPPVASIPAELARLCKWANDDGPEFEHPILRACILHFWLAYLHPFADGNGRTARALFYFYLLKRGYRLLEFVPISRVILRRRGQYDRAYLYAESDDADMTYFLVFHLHCIEKALKELWTYIGRRAQRDRELANVVSKDLSFNYRQRALLSRAIADRDSVFTVESHRASHNVSYPTARDDLLDLAERGYLNKGKEGRAFVFTPPEDLGELLGR